MTVPASYWGLWQRTLLATDDRLDMRSTVYWLQTGSWHADIRIPADRPDFTGTTSLADCSSAQLQWLARQQGFAGITVVTGDQCIWKHVIDFQPPSGKRDIASMQFAHPDKLLEYGIEDAYCETWERVADDKYGHCHALQLLDQGTIAEPASYLLVSGNHFIHARNRPAGLAQLFQGSGQLSCYPQQLLAQLLDFEISFGLIRGAGDPWQITLSTLPWREGQSLFENEAVLTQANGLGSGSSSGQAWRVLRLNPELAGQPRLAI